MREVLTRRHQLAKHETIIEKGIGDAYKSLEAIRDEELYTDSHETFEAYCKERWGISRSRAYQLINASTIAANLSTIVDKTPSEAVMRPLTKLPPAEQRAAFKEAVKKAPDGVPTARQVQAEVDRRLTHVNGIAKPDPPEIAKARANGKIPHDAVVTIELPDEPTTVDEVAEDHEQIKAQSEDELSDEDWLETLPLAKKLEGYMLRDFKKDALAFRHLEKARAAYLHHAQRELKRPWVGPYGNRVMSFLKIEPPQKWNLCTGLENGGCGGKGLIGVNNLKCTKCNGCGYWIMGRKDAS